MTNKLTIILFVFSVLAAACAEAKAKKETKKKTSLDYVQDTLKKGRFAPKLVIVYGGGGIVGGDNYRSFQNEEPMHKVVIDYDIAMGVNEVTFEEYDLYCQTARVKCPADAGWGRERQPVINVSWIEAVAYTKWLTEQTGFNYRLPSEAEWEYAARGGSKTKFWWGDEYKQGVDHCDRDVGNCSEGSAADHPQVAGLFSANPFGLFNMTSNVSEWVLDCANPNHLGAPRDGSARLDGDCDSRMVKGSNWKNPQPLVHLSKRMALEKDQRRRQVGFRVVREL